MLSSKVKFRGRLPTPLTLSMSSSGIRLLADQLLHRACQWSFCSSRLDLTQMCIWDSVCLTFIWCLSKLYINCFLSLLNARTRLGNKSPADHVSVVSNLRWAEYSTVPATKVNTYHSDKFLFWCILAPPLTHDILIFYLRNRACRPIPRQEILVCLKHRPLPA